MIYHWYNGKISNKMNFIDGRSEIDDYISLYPLKVYKNFYEKELYDVFA